MREFKFLDYYTEYSYEGSIHRNMKSDACFMDAFNKVRKSHNIHYTIRLYKGIDGFKNGNSNGCLLSPKEIKKHINLAKKLFKFKSIVRTKDEYYEVNLYLKNVSPIYHKYILTWVRYLYEFPYNVIVIDAHKLRQIYKFETIYNLMNTIMACTSEIYRSIHQVPQIGLVEHLNSKELKSRISRITVLNNVFRLISNRSEDMMIPNQIDDCNVYDLEYWVNKYEDREPIYIKTYEYIRSRRGN